MSRLHRITSAEVWHYHLGSPVVVVELDESGEAPMLRETVLGQDVLAGQRLQHAVPGGTWFGARLLSDGDASVGRPSDTASDDYALVGCTVSPGFEFLDFELGERAALLARFGGDARAKLAIVRLT